MGALHDQTPVARDVVAQIAYLAQGVDRPINYPSAPGGSRDENTGAVDLRDVTIRDARAAGEPPALQSHGFELRRHRSEVENFFDDSALESDYSRELIDVLKQATGARDVSIFDFTRRSDSEEERRRLMVRDTATNAHNDYTPRSAVQRLRDICGDDAPDRFLGRFAIVNVWRSIGGPARTTPLALCDYRSLEASQLISVERRAKDRVGEFYQLTYAAGNRWFYYPDMMADEVLLITTFDSRPVAKPKFAPHCGFRNPRTTAGDLPRVSVEARAFVFY